MDNWQQGLHPDLVAKVTRALNWMQGMGHPMRVCQALRTAEYQQGLYASGRTKPGRILTNCDGVIKKSNHQAAADGLGHAVDCCFVGIDPFLEHDPNAALKWQAYGRAGEAEGLVWGGRFRSPVDLDHLELPMERTQTPPADAGAPAS